MVKGGFLMWFRRDNSSENCDSSVNAFPETFLNNNPTNWAVFVGSFIFSCYIFWGIGICCRRYLVPSVTLLCDKFHIEYDIGGAVFLAFSTSAPELFTCVVATFLTESDFGISTVIGSCVFNALLITGFCGIICKEELILSSWSILRDNFWYFMSSICVSIAIYDGVVKLWEAVALILVYFLMLFCIFFDKRLRKCIERSEDDSDLSAEEKPEDTQLKCMDMLWGFPKDGGCLRIFLWILGRPFYWIFAVTIPKAHVTFLGSLAVAVGWLAILCYLASWAIKLCGYHIFIPDGVLGVTFMAVGTSMPELVTSYIVSRKGYGGMAVSNAVGSNTFNNLVALGVPWILGIIYHGHDIEMDSGAMFVVFLSVLFTVFFLQTAFFISRWRLGKFFGSVCLIFYAAYILMCIIVIIHFCKFNK